MRKHLAPAVLLAIGLLSGCSSSSTTSTTAAIQTVCNEDAALQPVAVAVGTTVAAVAPTSAVGNASAAATGVDEAVIHPAVVALCNSVPAVAAAAVAPAPVPATTP